MAPDVRVDIDRTEGPAIDARTTGSSGDGPDAILDTDVTTGEDVASTDGGPDGVGDVADSGSTPSDGSSEGTVSSDAADASDRSADIGGSDNDGGCTGGPGVAGPSCSGLAAFCGPNANGNCCASSVVCGGTYNRSNDPNYPATVSDFRLDTYEATVGRFRKFVAAYSQNMIPSGAGKNVHNPSDPGWDTAWNASMPADAATLAAALQCESPYYTWTSTPSVNESRPINCLTWYEAEAFCIWDGGRLATEAEWNYAAAGGSEQRLYPWGATEPGADANLAAYACYYNGTGTCTDVSNIALVGSIPAGNGRWGHADLAGNVWEWVQDWAPSTYPAGTCNDCADLTTAFSRAHRGGAYVSYQATIIRTTKRGGRGPGGRSSDIGVRCARVL